MKSTHKKIQYTGYPMLQSRKAIYSLLALGFTIAIIYHLTALIAPNSFPPSPAWRHSLFIVLNTIALLLTIKKWIWLWIPFTILTIQQLISHGTRAYDWWMLQHRIDGISLIIIVLMPVIALFLFYDFKLRLKAK